MLPPLRAPAIEGSAVYAVTPPPRSLLLLYAAPAAAVVAVGAAAAVAVVVAVVAVEAVALDSHKLLTICVSSTMVCHPKCWRMPFQLQSLPNPYSIRAAAAASVVVVVVQWSCHSPFCSNPSIPIASAACFYRCPATAVASTVS